MTSLIGIHLPLWISCNKLYIFQRDATCTEFEIPICLLLLKNIGPIDKTMGQSPPSTRAHSESRHPLESRVYARKLPVIGALYEPWVEEVSRVHHHHYHESLKNRDKYPGRSSLKRESH